MRRGNIIKFQMLQQTAGGCPTFTITPSGISNLTVGVPVIINLTSIGGTAPYTYSVSSGSLPTGLTLNGGTGVISGTPTNTGAASFQITSTDANSCTGVQSYSFNVNYEADAQAFITATGITNTTQQNAINTLVVDLKGYGIWSKMKAIYPFVGGTASTHKWNLKDPRDLDAAFRLVFNGGWTHSATGAKANGTNGFAETFLIPNTTLNINSQHLTYYNRSSLSGTYIDMGAFNTGYSVVTSLALNVNGNFSGGIVYSIAAHELKYATTQFLGLYTLSRTANNLMKSYRNGTSTGTNTVAIGTNNVITSIYINRRNNEGNYSPRECAFASIGDGLTDTEASNLYTIVQTYQTALNRQV